MSVTKLCNATEKNQITNLKHLAMALYNWKYPRSPGSRRCYSLGSTRDLPGNCLGMEHRSRTAKTARN